MDWVKGCSWESSLGHAGSLAPPGTRGKRHGTRRGAVTRAEEGWDERARGRAALVSVPLVPPGVPLVPRARPETALSPKLRPGMDALERRAKGAVERREEPVGEPHAPRERTW